MNEIIELLKDSKNDDKLEQALILSYNASNSLPLYLVPHRFRNKGFFYNECLRKHQYDLIPNLTSEEIKTLKKELLEKSNALNRVDASAFNIKRVKADIYYLRAYLFQLMNDDFGLSKSCGDKFKTLNKKIEELSENEIFEIVPFEIQVDPRGIPINDRYYLELYHFNHESIADRNDFTNYPELFTDIKQVSFDQGGLIVFGLYGAEIFKLFTSKGKLISMPCDDLEILINGKFRKTYSGDSLDFNLLKYSLLTDSVININSFSDFGSGAFEFLSIYNRDSLQIEIGKTVPERIENFKKPKSKNEAKTILLDANCNWITSPELSKFYENDKELALLAVSRKPIAFSLLSKDLMFDESIQKVLCLSANWDLLYYIKEWNLSIENILTLEELCEVIKKNGKLLSVLSNKIRLNRDCVIAAISNDSSNLKYADESLKKDMKFALELVKLNGRVLNYIDDSLKSDKQIVLAAVQESVYAIKFCSDSLLADEEFICEAYKCNPDIISYLDTKTINQHKRLHELNDDYKSREKVQENILSLEFASQTLQADEQAVFEVVKNNGCELQFASATLQNNKLVVFEAVKNNGLALEFASESLKNNMEVVLEVTNKLGAPGFEFASESLKNDKKLVLGAINNYMSLKFASASLQHDKEVVLLAVKKHGINIKFASAALQNDKEVALVAVKNNGLALRYVNKLLRKDKEIVLESINKKRYAKAIVFCSKSLLTNEEFISEAYKRNPDIISYLDTKTINQHKRLHELNDDYKSTNVESLLADGKIGSLMNEIEVNINNEGDDESTIDLTNASDEEVLRAFQFMGSVDNIVVTKDDKGNTHLKDEETGNEYMIVAEGEATLMPQTDDDLSYNDYEDFYYEEPKLKYLSSELQNDKKVVLKAVKRDGMALEFASVALQNDKEVVLLAIKRNVKAIKFASLVLQNDKEVLLELIKEYYWLLEYSFGFDDDGKLFLEDSKKNDEAFRFALVALQNNKEVLLMAIKNAGWLLQFASESLKSDIEIVLEAVKSDVSALEYASESLKSYREFMLVMVKSNGSALQYASESLKSDPEVVIEAIKNDYLAFIYCSELLRNDVDFICEAYKLNLNIMYCIDATKINHHKRLQELFDDYKSREEEQEEQDDLPF